MSIVSNLPFIGGIDLSDRPTTLEDGSRAYSYDAELSVGFPFPFQEITSKKASYSFVSHAGNILIATANLIALIYCAQTFFGQFSLRTFIVFIALVALIVAIGKVVFTFEEGRGELLYVATIFLSPLGVLLPAFVLNYYRSH